MQSYRVGEHYTTNAGCLYLVPMLSICYLLFLSIHFVVIYVVLCFACITDCSQQYNPNKYPARSGRHKAQLWRGMPTSICIISANARALFDSWEPGSFAIIVSDADGTTVSPVCCSCGVQMRCRRGHGHGVGDFFVFGNFVNNTILILLILLIVYLGSVCLSLHKDVYILLQQQRHRK